MTCSWTPLKPRRWYSVFNLLRGQFWGLLPHTGDTLHLLSLNIPTQDYIILSAEIERRLSVLMSISHQGLMGYLTGSCLLWPRSPISATAELLLQVVNNKMQNLQISCYFVNCICVPFTSNACCFAHRVSWLPVTTAAHWWWTCSGKVCHTKTSWQCAAVPDMSWLDDTCVVCSKQVAAVGGISVTCMKQLLSQTCYCGSRGAFMDTGGCMNDVWHMGFGLVNKTFDTSCQS